MLWGLDFNQTLALFGIFLLGSVLASKASAKLGIPALVLFIVLGMLAGSDGPGGLHFENYKFAQLLGELALAFIIFSGGLDTDWEAVRPVMWRGISLSTLGVAITCGLVALFATTVLQFSIYEGLLLGAVVSSTDAAAVFSVLRARSIKLRRRLIPLLEFESGTNDPTAVLLTITFIEVLQKPDVSGWALAGNFVLQMALGLLVGWITGKAARWMMSNVRLEYDGLYPAMSMAMVLLAFGGSHTIGGNGYLAVYISGLTMGRRNFLHRLSLIQFHDGLAWLMQIAMFLTLGLLSYPSKLLQVAGVGLLLALFLVLVARPIAVYVALLLARMRRRERVFIAWGGLRGAVPIILAIFPLLSGVPKSEEMFHLVFFVVLVSVLLQSTTLTLVAKWLGVVVPTVKGEPLPEAGTELIDVDVMPGSWADGKMVVNLGLPTTALLVLLKRRNASYVPRGSTTLLSGDSITLATRKQDGDDLRKLFEG
ncbi:MAG TPA: potassium/proton antiporter [Fimbriimonadaceae bacterium]|nr:potassium/proton antiporter [Fimbriimonadaceae bacterium]